MALLSYQDEMLPQKLYEVVRDFDNKAPSVITMHCDQDFVVYYTENDTQPVSLSDMVSENYISGMRPFNCLPRWIAATTSADRLILRGVVLQEKGDIS